MKIYLLKSDTSLFIVSEIVITKDYYLVPVPNTYTYDSYSKKIFTLTEEEVKK